MMQYVGVEKILMVASCCKPVVLRNFYWVKAHKGEGDGVKKILWNRVIV